MIKKFVTCFFMLFICAMFFPEAGLTAGKSDVGAMLPKELTSQNAQKYSANVKTMKYHKPDCKFYDCRDCTRFFKTPNAAQKAGFVACKVCGG